MRFISFDLDFKEDSHYSFTSINCVSLKKKKLV